MSRPLLSVADLRVRYVESDRPAVEAASFELAAGESLGIVGASGSGKTSLAMALLGLLPHSAVSAGSVRLGDTDLNSLDDTALQAVRGKRLSMVFQNTGAALDPVRSIGRQLVDVLIRHRHLSRQQAWQAAIEALSATGFQNAEQRSRQYPHQLSGGMKQRVMVAMALACEPDVVIADEPTSALDPGTQAQIMELICRRARAVGSALILITHDLGLVAHYCDRALVMHNGKIIEQAPVSQLFAEPQHPHSRALLAAAQAAEAC